MSFDAQMRIGSVEMLGGLLAFAAIAWQLPPAFIVRARPPEMEIALRIRALGAAFERDLRACITEKRAFTIGRSAACDLRLEDAEVSREHARIELSRGVLYIADRGSSNGTFLNGERLEGAALELRVGDAIDVGGTRVIVRGMSA